MRLDVSGESSFVGKVRLLSVVIVEYGKIPCTFLLRCEELFIEYVV
jgi:hypothetical protein